MKKNLKKIKIGYVLTFLLGLIVAGSIGVYASNILLRANQVQYTEDKTVQSAIEDLYELAESCSNCDSDKNLEVSISIDSSNIELSYTGSYISATCQYGTTSNYGSTAAITNNKCIISGTVGTKYYYKITVKDDEGVTYVGSGSTTIKPGGTIVTSGIPTGTVAIIYMDPADLTHVCNSSNTHSLIGMTSGCMKWYAFSYANNKYTMISDHNVSYSYSYATISSNLTSLKSVWGNTIGSSNISLLTKTQLIDITGVYSVSFSNSTYSWLVENTSSSGPKGYWLSTSSSSNQYYVRYDGKFEVCAKTTTDFGLRPVLVVPKNKISMN